MSIIVKLCIYLNILFLVSCLHSSDDKNNDTTMLEGNWIYNCTYIAADDRYDNGAAKYFGNNFELLLTRNPDSNCSMPIYTLKTVGTFLVGGSIILDDGTTVNEIDRVLTNWKLTPSSDATAESYNSVSFCNYDLWLKGIEVDVSECSLFGGETNRFDIFYIENDRLYFGDSSTGDGTSDDSRQTELLNTFYLKE